MLFSIPSIQPFLCPNSIISSKKHEHTEENLSPTRKTSLFPCEITWFCSSQRALSFDTCFITFQHRLHSFFRITIRETAWWNNVAHLYSITPTISPTQFHHVMKIAWRLIRDQKKRCWRYPKFGFRIYDWHKRCSPREGLSIHVRVSRCTPPDLSEVLSRKTGWSVYSRVSSNGHFRGSLLNDNERQNRQ